MPAKNKEVDALLSRVDEPRRNEAREIFEFIQSCVPKLEPYVISGMIGFGTFHYKGKTREGDWFKVGMGCNKSSLSVYSCASNDKGMLPEQYADRLGKVNVGKSCIRFKKWADVNQPVLRELLVKSAEGRFDFG